MKIRSILIGLAVLTWVACGEKGTTETDLKADDFEAVVTVNSGSNGSGEWNYSTGSGNVQLIDVRTAQEFNDGYIANAKNIDFYAQDFKQQIEASVKKDQPVYLYCKAGGRSGKAVKMLKEMGYEEVYDLRGGFDSWKAYKKPIVEPNAPVVEKVLSFEEALSGEKLIMVDFTAVWCRPCQEMKPAIEKLRDEMKDEIAIVQVDVDNQRNIAESYAIGSMPTLVFIKDGKEVYREIGYKSEEDLKALIQLQIEKNS